MNNATMHVTKIDRQKDGAKEREGVAGISQKGRTRTRVA